ncbi:MAG: hypothetical protein AUK60_10135 [Rhodobacteraceae bacterium CG2_30_10_405]|nr:MAG: hypothetical protein AUK60_10135 [Rhodobacteraceae bacterium CG2_30_10_405]
MARRATDRIAATTACGGLRTRLAMLGLPVLLAACTAAPAATQAVAPEVYELANMRPGNVVPKSSPAALVSAFGKYCLDGPPDPAGVAARLRAADYVAVPQTTPNGITAFVVDDSRPMVMVSDDGRTCAVGAASRTGQSARIRGLIAKRFPGATPLDPASVSPNTELAVQAPGAQGGVIFLQRLAPAISHSRLILGIWRTS